MAALGAIEEDLSCSYCLDLFVEPQQLECGHNLCRKCVETMTAFALARLNAPESLPVTALKRSGKLEVEGSPAAAPAAAAPDPLTCIECPLCRATSRLSTLKVNINLKNLSEAARARKQETSVLCSVCDGTPNKAEADCVNCGFSFCSTCLEPHKKQIYRSHVLQPAGFLAKQTPVRMCSVPSHSTKPVELICKQCDALVCFTCAQFGKHKGHDCESFDEAVEKKSAEMKGLVEQVAKLTQDIDVTQSKLADELKTQNEVHSRLRERLVDHFDALLRRAAQMKEELVAQLDEAIESTDTICNDHNKSLLSVSARAKAVAESAKSFSSNVDVQNPLPAMQRCVQLLGLVKELQAVNLNTSYRSPVQLSIAEDLSALNDFGVSLRFGDPFSAVLPDCTIADSKTLEPLLRFLSIRMPGRKYSLVYRGSRDGFDASAFHSKCNNIGPTLTIARSQQGYVFGAYSSVPWGSSGPWIADSQAFLFTVNGGSKRSFLVSDLFQNIRHSVYDHASQGPTFGRNHDLRVQGNTAYCNVGHSYCVPPGESNTYLFGASQEAITELMVYSVATESVNIQVPTDRVSDEIAKFVCGWFSSFGYAVKPTDPLYSSTRDGRSNNMFHAKCDNKGPTFTVVFTATGHIFGGFTNTSWRSNGTQGSDPRAFLFLLHDGASKRWLFQRHCVTVQQQATYDEAQYGPTFGGAPDDDDHDAEYDPFDDAPDYNQASDGPTFGAGHDLHINLDNPGSSYVNIQDSYDATGFSHALWGGRSGWNILEVRVYGAQPSSFVPSV